MPKKVYKIDPCPVQNDIKKGMTLQLLLKWCRSYKTSYDHNNSMDSITLKG
jgi:hypothetical protein